jgi:hypothetical protein
MKLETFRSDDSPDRAAMDRMLAACREEMKVAPPSTWRVDLARLLAGCWALAAATLAVLTATGELGAVTAHAALPALSLLGAGAACAFLGVSPSAHRGWALLAVAAAAAAMLGVHLEVTDRVDAGPGWLCTVSHLGLGAGPLVFGVLVMRKAAVSPLRALLIGLAAGTTGALVGELACARSWEHVAVFHLGAWASLGLIALAVSRFVRPRSFAP